jgi:hypothetical protein
MVRHRFGGAVPRVISPITALSMEVVMRVSLAKQPVSSGYTHCGCRGCFDTTVSSDMARPELCDSCEESGCELNGGECQRPDAYGFVEYDGC